MSQSRLLLVMSDSAWTSAALHLACAMARRRQTDIVLLKMVPVRHPVLLGTAAQPSRESAKVDSVATVVVGWQRVPGIAERRRVDEYLSRRLSMDSLVVSHILTPPRR